MAIERVIVRDVGPRGPQGDRAESTAEAQAAAAEATAAANQAAQSAAQATTLIGSTIIAPTAESVRQGQQTILPQAVAFETAGDLLPADGGRALFVEEPTEPAHPLKIHVGSRWFGFRDSEVTPEIGGARGSGTGNSTQAFRDVADYCAQRGSNGLGTTVSLQGHYLLDNTVDFPLGDVTIDGHGRSLVDFSWVNPATEENTPIFRFYGAGLLDSTTVTADLSIASGATTVIPVADASIFSPGDYVFLTSGGPSGGEYWSGIPDQSGFGPRWKGEHLRVRSVDVLNSTVTIEAGLRDSYDATSYTVTLRRASVMKNITLKNFKVLGPGHMSDFAAESRPSFFLADFRWFHNVRVENLDIENIARFTIFAANGWDFTAINVNQVGRKLNDPTNLPNIWNVQTGMSASGVSNVQVIGCSARYLRRLCNVDVSPFGSMNPSDGQECVVTRDVQYVGGFSEAVFTGPGGHMVDGCTVTGHIVNRAATGINFRGKNLIATGNRLLNCANAFVLGVGSSSSEDSTQYVEDPSSGRVLLANNEVRASSRGIYATNSFDSLSIIGGHWVCPAVLTTYGKHASNVLIDGITAVGTASEQAVQNYFSQSASNWNIRNSTFSEYTGIIRAGGGSITPQGDLLLENCSIDSSNLGVAYALIGNNPYSYGDNIRARNCKVKPALVESGAVFIGGTGGGNKQVYADGCNWENNGLTITLSAGGDLALPTTVSGITIRVETNGGASSQDLNTISGGLVGQIIFLCVNNPARQVTVKDSSGALNIGSDYVMSLNSSIIQLQAYRNSAGDLRWRQISRR